MDSLAKMFNMNVKKFIAANGGIPHTAPWCSADRKDSTLVWIRQTHITVYIAASGLCLTTL